MNLQDMVNQLLQNGHLKTSVITEAFLNVDRADFVPTSELPYAYEDIPLSIGHHQTISQPSTVAFMLDLLNVQPGNRVLDIGSGSGWTTALLAYLTGPYGKVWGLERVPDLVEFGKQNLSLYPYPWAKIEQSQTLIGLLDKAPFERILVSASAPELCSSLIQQLTFGGTMIIPIKNSLWKCTRKSNDQFDAEEYPGFIFVPLL